MFQLLQKLKKNSATKIWRYTVTLHHENMMPLNTNPQYCIQEMHGKVFQYFN